MDGHVNDGSTVDVNEKTLVLSLIMEVDQNVLRIKLSFICLFEVRLGKVKFRSAPKFKDKALHDYPPPLL